MENGIKVFERCFNVNRLVKSSTSITRFFKKFNSRSLNEQLLENIGSKFIAPILAHNNIKQDTLRFDSTIITRFGEQEGAKKGYNPAKRGRPSHHPQIAFLGSGYTVNFWNRSGNTSSANGILGFYNQTRNFISNIDISRVLADSGYYHRDFISKIEEDDIDYVIAVPIYQFFQKIVYDIQDWIKVDEFSTPYEIWNYYRPRANDENIIKNLKEGFGLSAYNMKSFWATEAVLMIICLIFHNLITLLVKKVIEPRGKREQLKTLRMKYLVVPALMGKNGRDDVIRLGISNTKRKTKFLQILERIKNMRSIFNCNAVEVKLT